MIVIFTCFWLLDGYKIVDLITGFGTCIDPESFGANKADFVAVRLFFEAVFLFLEAVCQFCVAVCGFSFAVLSFGPAIFLFIPSVFLFFIAVHATRRGCHFVERCCHLFILLGWGIIVNNLHIIFYGWSIFLDSVVFFLWYLMIYLKGEGRIFMYLKFICNVLVFFLTAWIFIFADLVFCLGGFEK